MLSVRLVDSDFGGGELEVSTSGVAADELLVAFVDTDNAGTPGPSGWTIVATDQATGADVTWIFVKDTLGPGDATYTFEIGGGADGSVLLCAVAGSVGDPVFDAADATGVAEQTSTSMVAPSAAMTAPNGLLVCHWMLYSGTDPGSITPPGGMVELVDNVRSNGWGHRSIYSQIIISAGATGTRTATASSDFGHVSSSVGFSEDIDAVLGVAHADLGGLTATATGSIVISGTATASLGGLTAHAAQASPAVVGSAHADLGGLSATMSGGSIPTGDMAATFTFTAHMRGFSEAARPHFRLRGPTYDENLWTSDRFLIRYRLPRGITLAVLGAEVVELTYPYQGDLAQYDHVYMGGYDHLLTTPEANLLIAAGYADFITPLEE